MRNESNEGIEEEKDLEEERWVGVAMHCVHEQNREKIPSVNGGVKSSKQPTTLCFRHDGEGEDGKGEEEREEERERSTRERGVGKTEETHR